MSAEENENLASDLAALGYPGLSYLKAKRTRGPAEVVFTALSSKDVDCRLMEALPWVLLHYPNLDWRWLVREARLNELQNKLGFLTSLARMVAEASGLLQTTKHLKEWEVLGTSGAWDSMCGRRSRKSKTKNRKRYIGNAR
jgi:hypothetical protein